MQERILFRRLLLVWKCGMTLPLQQSPASLFGSQRRIAHAAERPEFGVKQLQGSEWLLKTNTCESAPGLCWYRRLFTYLEDEHLSPQDGEGVEASVTDVGLGVGVGRPVSRGQPRRSRLPVWLAWVWRRVGAGRGCRRQRLGGLGNLIRGSWTKTEKNISPICKQKF